MSDDSFEKTLKGNEIIEALRAEVASLNKRLEECVGGTKRDLAKKLEQQQKKSERLTQQLNAAKEQNALLAAKIDRLMLEYCPDEMTEDQMTNWEAHQKPAITDLNQQVKSEDAREWISVNDRLPDQDGCYLVFTKLNERVVLSFANGKWNDFDDDYGSIEMAEQSIVTDWMPIPPPPSTAISAQEEKA